MSFYNCETAIHIIWDWGWVWKSLSINGGDVGVRLYNEDPNGNGHVGSVAFVDSEIRGVGKAIVIAPASERPLTGSTGVVLDNTYISGPIVDTAGKQYLGAGSYNNWVLGPVYKDNKREFTFSKIDKYSREETLLGPSQGLTLPGAPYLERKRNQYEDKSAGDFVHLKDLGAKGSWLL